jgi:Arc/MetJ family transcription regulator
VYTIHTERCRMRTNIVIDEKILREAFSVSEAKTKKDLIHEALMVLISFKKRRDLTELAGKIEFKEDYNYKTMRKVRG